MLPRKYKLSKHDFWKVKSLNYKKAVLNTPLFNLIVCKNETPNAVPKFAFVVSGKIDKRAVVRNKLRRYFSNAVRQCLGVCQKGYFYIFYIKPAAKGKSNEEISNFVNKTLSKNVIP